MQNNFLKFFLVVALFFTLTTAAFAESWISRVMGSLLPSGNSWSASVFNLTSGDLTQRNLSNSTVQKTDTASLAGTSTVTNASKASATSMSIIPVDKWKLKCATTTGQQPQPQIEVLSPNGGETFMAGQQITVNWRSCNVPQGTIAMINLDRFDSNGNQVSSATLIPQNFAFFGNNTTPTQNDGVEIFTIPQQHPVLDDLGKKFKIRIHLASGSVIGNLQYVAHDSSDNLFTINDNNGGSNSGTSSSGTSSSVTSTVPLLLRPIDARAGFNFSSSPINAGNLNLNYLFSVKNTSNQPIWIKCNVLSPQLEFAVSPFGPLGSSHQCASSLGDLNNDVLLNPNQEIYVSQMMAFPVNQSPQVVQAQFRGTAKFIYYKQSQSATNFIQADPALNPGYQPSWDAILTTPWVTY